VNSALAACLLFQCGPAAVFFWLDELMEAVMAESAETGHY
jgi:hypothetical protein